MSYQESKKMLDDIRARHGEVMFRMAISHLMDVGIRNLDKDTCTSTCKEIMAQDDSKSFMTNQFQCELIWSSYELAQIPHIDLLVYIQRHINYDVNDNYLSYDRVVSLLRSCVDWSTCDQLPEDALSDLYGIGFSNDEITFVGYGKLLKVED